MYVWILQVGEDHMGGHIVGVYRDKRKAVRKARSSQSEAWGLRDSHEDLMLWTDGSDWMEVRRWEVEAA